MRRWIAAILISLLPLAMGAEGCEDRKGRSLTDQKTTAEGIHIVTMSGYSGTGGWAVRISWVLRDGTGKVKEQGDKTGANDVSARIQMSTRDRSLTLTAYTPSGKEVACLMRTAAKGNVSYRDASNGTVTCTLTGEGLS